MHDVVSIRLSIRNTVVATLKNGAQVRKLMYYSLRCRRRWRSSSRRRSNDDDEDARSAFALDQHRLLIMRIVQDVKKLRLGVLVANIGVPGRKKGS